VSETVTEVKAKEGEAPARFANACLRKVAEHAQAWRAQAFPAADGKQNAQWASLPEWLWMKVFHQKGQDWALAFSEACLERPTLWIRGKTAEWKPEWARTGPIQNSWQVTESGSLVQKSGFQEGEFIVQDISSQYLISEITSRVQNLFGSQNRALTALDLCAAPGGKSVGLAWNGFQVTATDRNDHRVPLLQQTISRVAPEIELLPWDQLSQCPQKDLVWVDAPCSGTGIIRRHPDVRWLRQEKEIIELTKTQRALLKDGWDRVLPGGFLVYSVCSVLEEEGPRAIRDSGLQDAVIDQWALSPHLAPHGDGFWAALLRKKS
jgi:16S rRNA (cytosine967-C5)-methyltransferase